MVMYCSAPPLVYLTRVPSASQGGHRVRALYTVYGDSVAPPDRLCNARSFDITCCDVDVAVLARNALLFTLLADDGVLDKLDSLWDVFYHMFLDQTSLSVLLDQCRKLVPLAESTETWRAGPYGHFLTACDRATLAAIRHVWGTYLATASFSSKQAKRFHQHFTDGMKETLHRTGSTGTTTAARSAGPLALHAPKAVERQFSTYWSSGVTDGVTQGKKQRMTVNPTFAFSVDGDRFAVHYGTDPLCGFHLAEAFASGKFTRSHEHIPPREMVRIAREQFSRWCTSVSQRLKNSNPSSPTFVIRMFGGDALTFSQALKYCQVTGSPATPYNVAAWRLSTITLDPHYYGRNALSLAPLSFNVIETSNILDHVGLVNILVVTAPLLRVTPSATLYTEALIRTGNDPSQAILEHIGGDLPTMALLLGVIPVTMLSKFTTRSNVHETLTTNEGAKQYHERLAWKAVGFGGLDSEGYQASPRRLYFSPDDLAAFLFRIYLYMFSDEDITSRFRLLTHSPEVLARELQRSCILHYNRRSFAIFVHFVKTRVHTDWWRTMDRFEDLVLADEQLSMGAHAYQELCCQLHLLGLYTAPCMSVVTLDEILHNFSGSGGDRPGLFRDWTSVPKVVTVVLVVPREAIARLEPDFKDVGTPVLHCDMHDGPRQNWFAVTLATFGTLHVTGTGEHRTGMVVEGEIANGTLDTSNPQNMMRPPWRTKAPLIITFSIPSVIAMDFARNPGATVGLALRANIAVTWKFADRLGYNLTVFRTKLSDAQRVFILAERPVVGMGTGKDKNVVPTCHWQQDVSSTHEHKTKAGVQVEMNDISSAARSFVIRIDITDPGAQTVLADARTFPTIQSTSGSTQSLGASVKIGTHTYDVQFPLPVDVALAKFRVARRSSYVEVVAPLAPFDFRPERNLSARFASLSSDPDDDGVPELASIHRVNLDRCPAFQLATNPPTSVENWCSLHLRMMFSESEQRRAVRENADPSTIFPDTLLHVKQSLLLLLRGAAGAYPDGRAPERVFALLDMPSKVPYLYVIVARVCLDVASHTVLADAFVALNTPAVRAALEAALAPTGKGDGHDHSLSDRAAIRYIATDADETEAWFHLLPRLTERCRTRPHKASCAYRTSKKQSKSDENTAGTWGKRNPLCTCGEGVGTEILPEEFKPLAPHLTRAAFSPLFSVPYLKEVDVPVVGKGAPGMPRKSTETVPTNDRDVDAGNKDAARAGILECRFCGKQGDLTCSRCKGARYCSKACQRADWKAHKKNCNSD